MAALGTLFSADLHSTSWNVMPSNCGVRTVRTKPMRCRPGRAPSSTFTPWPSHRTILFEHMFDNMSRSYSRACPLAPEYSPSSMRLRVFEAGSRRGREAQGREPHGARHAGHDRGAADA